MVEKVSTGRRSDSSMEEVNTKACLGMKDRRPLNKHTRLLHRTYFPFNKPTRILRGRRLPRNKPT
jgi:hypothetical protein